MRRQPARRRATGRTTPRSTTGVGVPLRRPAFRRLFAAHAVSRAGDAFNAVALPVLVFDLTGSGIGTAGVVVAEVLPVLLLAPVAGLVVDRWPRVAVLVAADLWRAAAAAALALGAGSVAAVYVAAAALAAGTAFFNPAAQAAIPGLVDERELVAANSALWSVAVTLQIVLAPVAGLAIAGLGPSPAFGLNAATFAASAAILRGVRLARSRRAVTVAPAALRTRLRAAARLVVAGRLLSTLAAVQLLAALSAGATSALLVVLAERHLEVSAGGFGVLLAAIGVGAAAGPLLLARLTANPRRPALVFGSLGLRGAVDLVLASSSSLGVAAVALGAYGVGTSTGTVAFNALLQSTVSEDRRGRVFAGFDALWQGGRLVSLGAGGVLAEVLGVRAVYALGGALLLAAALLGLLRSREVKL